MEVNEIENKIAYIFNQNEVLDVTFIEGVDVSIESKDIYFREESSTYEKRILFGLLKVSDVKLPKGYYTLNNVYKTFDTVKSLQYNEYVNVFKGKDNYIFINDTILSSPYIKIDFINSKKTSINLTVKSNEIGYDIMRNINEKLDKQFIKINKSNNA